MIIGAKATLNGVEVKIEVEIDADPNRRSYPSERVARTHQGAMPKATGISNEAEGRVYRLLANEARRIAELAFVDLRDQDEAPLENARLRSADPNRSSVIVAAGLKDQPGSVLVVKGSIKAGGRMLSAVLPDSEAPKKRGER
jgi:hypothetical protein